MLKFVSSTGSGYVERFSLRIHLPGFTVCFFFFFVLSLASAIGYVLSFYSSVLHFLQRDHTKKITQHAKISVPHFRSFLCVLVQ